MEIKLKLGSTDVNQLSDFIYNFIYDKIFFHIFIDFIELSNIPYKNI